MTDHIGQIVPYTAPRRIVSGPETPPIWHCLIVPPQKERAAREFLRKRDIFSFFPSEEITRVVAGKKRTIEKPMITQHVYAQFRQQPQWDVMKRVHRLITGVYCIGGKPVAIPRDVIRHLQGMTVEAERLRAAQAELMRIREGDTAEIVEGPLAGFSVSVVGTSNGEAWWEMVSGAKGKMPVSRLRRVLP